MSIKESDKKCKHEGCISWIKPFDYAYKERKPYLFCNKCNNWIEVSFK